MIYSSASRTALTEALTEARQREVTDDAVRQVIGYLRLYLAIADVAQTDRRLVGVRYRRAIRRPRTATGKNIR